MSVTPVIVCGQSEEVGKAFSHALKPDFEVIYFTTSPDSALTDIPTVLKGSIPTSTSSSTLVGSGNLSHGTPKAVIISAPAYDDLWVVALRQELLQMAGKHVIILKPDASGYADGGAVGDKAAADKAKVAAEHAVKLLNKLDDEGKLDGDEDGEYVY
ncbi:hypothetical protein F5Y06DRAFT_64951 [Hypoxylon sp. FL0890]|nr:hypothetical protein F5Y06DRAFT_64951 [Hypoxylon sp. FL0890]